MNQHPRIAVRTSSQVAEARGDSHLRSVTVRSEGHDEPDELAADAMFLLIGARPITTAVEGWLRRDEHGFLLTGEDVVADARRHLVETHPGSLSPGVKPTRRVRRRRPSAWLHQARRIRSRRGRHGRVAHSPLSRSGTERVTVPSTMRAAVHDGYGDADVIRIDQVPVPTIADDEVLVRVEAAGVDRGTWHLLTGRPYLARLAIGLRRPRVTVLGRDVAGTVVATGRAVHRFAVGDSVFGVATGSFAEYAKAKERKLVRTPDRLSPVEAAVLGISGMTALQAIDAAHVKAGSTLLVIGASGGVGSYAVQIAHGLGARVTGVSRAAKADFVRSLGAERVIAYDRAPTTMTTAPTTPSSTPAETHSLSRLRSMLAPRGTLVIVGGEGGDAGDRYGPTATRSDLVAIRTSAAHLHRQPRTPVRPRTAPPPRRGRHRQAGRRHRVSTRPSG